MKSIDQSRFTTTIQVILFIVIQSSVAMSELSAASIGDKWISTSSPKCEVWFQNWGNYQRLLIVIDADTTVVLPSPYATEKKDKPYLKPKPYSKITKQQLKGNLYWKQEPSWKDDVKNSAKWEVDRANPKITLPQSFDVDFTLNNDEMRMKINQGNEPLLEAYLKKISSY